MSHNVIKIKLDDLSDGKIIALMQEHLVDMHATSPPESVHALDLQALKSPDITFFSAWDNDELAGCVALKRLNALDAELKSMRTVVEHRNKGVGSLLLRHTYAYATAQGFSNISLETGTQDYFMPAHQLYKKFGFVECPPFADYQCDPNSCFMRIDLH